LRLETIPPNLSFWHDAVKKLKAPAFEVTVAFVGKYVAMQDAYISILEALRHAGIAHNARVNLKWVDAEKLEGFDQTVRELEGVDAILVGPGFGIRGIEGKILTARFARERGVPYFGICLGLQVAVIEFARHIVGLESANSTEFDPYAAHPVIDLMPEQLEIEGLGGTMRLGDWPMTIHPGTLLERIYGTSGTVFERHRHRYEVNPKYVETLKDAGLIVSGVTPGKSERGAGLVEAIELRPSPPFRAFIGAALEQKAKIKRLEQPR
jgi:CTP synthase